MPLTRRRLLALAGGGGAALLTHPGSAAPSPRQAPRLREYWLSVDSFAWDLAPNGRDQMMGTTIPQAGRTYQAIGYRAYTANWGRPLAAGTDGIGANAGIPGPVLRAHVGDTIRVHLRNNDTAYRFPHSLHAHGVRYAPSSDGSYVAADPTKPGALVEPGATYTYEWKAAPSSVGTWVYHDHSLAESLVPVDSPGQMPGADDLRMAPAGDEMGGSATMELNAQLGMFGAIAITDDDTPPVDREFVLVLHDLYAADVPSLAHDFDCFNGRSYLGNTPQLEAKVGDRVRFRLAALGKEFHVFHVHGHRFRLGGRWTDTVQLGPSSSETIEWVEEDPGEWLYHCHVIDHMMGGMVGRYVVTTR